VELKPLIKRVLLEKEEKGEKIKQEDIAEAMGVSQQIVSNWINGKTVPRGPMMFKLAHFLGCKVDDLWQYKPE
jgi:transcriptional regulator with XRE-family HTH domain